jgi:hypothetical protein
VATRMQMLGAAGAPAEAADVEKDSEMSQEAPPGPDDDVPF